MIMFFLLSILNFELNQAVQPRQLLCIQPYLIWHMNIDTEYVYVCAHICKHTF